MLSSCERHCDIIVDEDRVQLVFGFMEKTVLMIYIHAYIIYPAQ